MWVDVSGGRLEPAADTHILHTANPWSVQRAALHRLQGGAARGALTGMHICETFLQFSMYADVFVVVANGVLICTKGKPHMRTADHTR